MDDCVKSGILKKASWFGIVGNGLLSAVKISFGLITGSLALVGDGIDSFTDIISSIITLITAGYIEEPPDSEHPWGHGRAETISTKLMSFIIFFAGSQLLISSVKRFFSETPPLPDKLAIWVTVFAIFGKIIVTLVKYSLGKKAKSNLLMADALNSKYDVFLSISVLIGIGLTLYLGIPAIDALTSFILSLFILRSAYKIFLETTAELMDSVEDPELYQKLFNALETVQGVHNPHRCRIRRISSRYDIDLDIEVDGSLSLREAHELAQEAEDAIKESLVEVYDIMIHVEPLGDGEHSEQFGLSPNSLIKD